MLAAWLPVPCVDGPPHTLAFFHLVPRRRGRILMQACCMSGLDGGSEERERQIRSAMIDKERTQQRQCLHSRHGALVEQFDHPRLGIGDQFFTPLLGVLWRQAAG